MKDTHVLCAACVIALIAITAVFIGYATDTLPQHKQRMIKTVLPAQDTSVEVKKKNCSCCKMSLEKILEQIEKFREQRRITKRSKSTVE